MRHFLAPKFQVNYISKLEIKKKECNISFTQKESSLIRIMLDSMSSHQDSSLDVSINSLIIMYKYLYFLRKGHWQWPDNLLFESSIHS